MSIKSERQLNEMVDILQEEEAELPLVVDVEAKEGPESPEGAEVTEYGDGSMVFSFGEEPEGDYDGVANVEHFGNLADAIPDDELRRMGASLYEEVQQDLASRSSWEDTLVQSMKQLGFTIEDKDTPWPGACSAVHPLLGESIVRFQSETSASFLPAGGPVKASVVGEVTQEKSDQALRVARLMNWVIGEKMDEYRPETERLLFGLGLAGAAFRKVFKNPVTNMPKSAYVPAQDLIVNSDASDIQTADRITHRMRMSKYKVDRLIRAGFYRSIPLTSPSAQETEIETAIDDLVGIETGTPHTTSRTVYECQCYWDLGEDPDGAYLPYVVTFDEHTMEVLSIYRNWSENDSLRAREHYIVHYEMIPGLGLYGFGFAHLIGNTSKVLTSLLQQLVDSGTLANIQGGLKTRMARMENDSGPIIPGEWRDVEVGAGKLSDHFMPVPSKEPSQTLLALVEIMSGDGRRLASMADMKMDDMNDRAQVGTTLALMEQARKMQTAIQHRIHAALKREFRILARVISRMDNLDYPYDTDEGVSAVDDFDDRIDVIPVSDPESSSLTQRMMKFQAIMTAAQQQPQVYNQQLLNRKFVEALGVEDADKLVPNPADIPAMDPVSENAAIMNLGKVSAKLHQDHDAHLRVHMSLMNDPELQQFLQNSPSGSGVRGALDAHIREHMAFRFREEVESEIGAQLPAPGQPLPEDVEARISRLAADAADQVTGKKAAAQQAQEVAEQQQDPIVQARMLEAQVRLGELQRKQQKDQMDFVRHQQAEQNRSQQAQQEAQLKMLDLARKAEEAAARNELEEQKAVLGQIAELARLQQEELNKGVEAGLKIAEMLEADKGGDG